MSAQEVPTSRESASRPRARIALRSTLSTLFAVLIAVAVLSTATVTGFVSLRATVVRLCSQSETIATLIADRLGAAGAVSDAGGLSGDARTLLERLASHDNIESIRLFDARRRVLFSVNAGEATEEDIRLVKQALVEGQALSRIAYTPRSFLFLDPPMLLVAVPIPHGQVDTSSALLLSLTTRDLNASARLQFLTATALCLVLISVGVMLSRSLVGRATESLGTLTSDMARLAEDNFKPDASIKASIESLKNERVMEIETLASGFESLLTRLEFYLVTLRETYQQKQKMEDEVSAARAIQMGLLPNNFDVRIARNVDLYAVVDPAKAVGGDLYDFFPIDSRHLYFVIGDVSDKGFPAALFMAITKTLLGAAVRDDPEHLQNALTAVNQTLLRNNPEGMFVTLVAGVLNMETGRVTYVDAGHEPAIVLNRAEGTARRIEKVGGEPLGLFEDTVYTIGTIQLGAGDAVVFYTDGVTEAMNPQRDQYTADRLEKALAPLASTGSAREIVDRVLEDVGEFRKDQAQSDDIALMAIRWEGR
ncbi:PP2C family protein-serine/threonine phosphatase [Phaeovibrio sulfidiphilus]|uniref:PP2C family protein-serine/threonine phosphatase n=1 Tax=Phaeovibrio sulfidiphilus TaxID=1220600 RepID=A0A8J7CPY9_9PROT|nr:PP2C family protein-serine/threonine phosphatase [Phaeovibrio sulfidiphilus]MBE1236255.1 PP2C family protein-serine/threonine phosphatase [Phaeovibrio sulfidiphilus]